jgi:hypothetical protein
VVDERRFWPCRDGEVKGKGEGEERIVRVPSSSPREDDMCLESLGSLEPSKPSKPSKPTLASN